MIDRTRPSTVKVSFSATMTQEQYEEFEKNLNALGLFVSKVEEIEHIKLDLIGGAKESKDQLTIDGKTLPKKKGRLRGDYDGIESVTISSPRAGSVTMSGSDFHNAARRFK